MKRFVFIVLITMFFMFVIATILKNSGEEMPMANDQDVQRCLDEVAIQDIEHNEVRTFLMGFSYSLPPLPRTEEYEKRFATWSPYADFSMNHLNVPWARLLAGERPDALAREFEQTLASVRAKNIDVIITLEPLDGIDRPKEAPELVVAGRSVAEQEIQALFRDYALAVARVTHPVYFGLVAEVNQLKHTADKRVYRGLVEMVHDTAMAIQKEMPATRLYVSMQAEDAWDGFGKWDQEKSYQGIADTLQDFSFVTVLGISSYPHFAWRSPADVPLNYYAKFREESGLPLIITEVGWPSRFSKISTSEGMQACWIRKLGILADVADARAVGYLLSTDFHKDIPVTNPILEQFSSQGLWDNTYHPKKALGEWKLLFKKTFEFPK